MTLNNEALEPMAAGAWRKACNPGDVIIEQGALEANEM